MSIEEKLIADFIEKIESDRKKVANSFMNITKYDMLPRCVWDFEETFLYVNGKFAQCFGYTQDEMNGHKFKEFILPEDYGKSIEEYTRNLENENITMIAGFTNRYVCKDGSIVTVLWHGYNDFENHLGSGQIEIIK